MTAEELVTSAPVVLFEPICRGSRLQILANFVGALRARSTRPIKIVTRADYQSKHLAELMGRFAQEDVEFIPSDTDLGGAWIKALDSAEMRKFLQTLATVVRAGQAADIVFMAIDDYLVAFAKNAGSIARRFGGCRISIFKWRVEYLLPHLRTSWRARILTLLTHWAVLRTRGRFICFDERLLDRTVGRSPVAVIPDPWFGSFSQARRDAARVKYGFGDGEFVMLAVGRQDRRKGLPLILHALKSLLSDARSRLLVVGAIDPSFASDFQRALRDYQNRIIHVNRFVDEEELPDIFACADVFLLPYARDFTASSGTLPRAAASGVPVVTGKHGLVGHRVNVLGLGELFDIDDVSGLAVAVERVRAYTPAKLMDVKRALRAFATNASIEVFESKIGDLFSDGTLTHVAHALHSPFQGKL
jgi:glycosyltransferase involved in cell wall biosynthesis